MKKSLLALAALSTIAGVAQAQSSVTLYGTIDASVGYVQNGGTLNSTGTTLNQPAALTSPQPAISVTTAAGYQTANAVGTFDSAVQSSVWGMKGSEDLGGGMKAIFQVEGDLNSVNAFNNASGVFRRGEFAGLQGGFGEITLGLRGNQLVAASAEAIVVANNSVMLTTKAAMNYGDDYTKNAITYISPVIAGSTAILQYGASNTVNDVSSGSTLNGAFRTTQGAFSALAAFQLRNSVSGSTSNLPATATQAADVVGTVATYTGVATVVNPTAANTAGNKTTYLAGLKYQVTPAVKVGYTYVNNFVDSAGVGAASAAGLATSTQKYTIAESIFSLGYQATPSLLVGLAYVVNTADSNMTNLIAKYSLSKRTTTYAQVGYVRNGNGYDNNGNSIGAMLPIFDQTSSTPIATSNGAQQVGAAASGYFAMPNTNVLGVNVGMIHTF
ncbi:MAG: porin [Betaproteobacteria bacterium]